MLWHLKIAAVIKKAFQVDENKDPITALAEQYLSIPCSVMSPNPGRFELLEEMIPGILHRRCGGSDLASLPYL